MALTKVLTGGIALDAVDNTILKLDDNYALTGTVTGAGGGKVGQVIQTVKSSATTTNSTTAVAISGMTANMTCAATNSKVLIDLTVTIGAQPAMYGVIQLFIGGSVSAFIGDAVSGVQRSSVGNFAGGNNALQLQGFSNSFLYSPSSTSEITYALYWQKGEDTPNIYLNRCHNNSTGNAATGISTLTLTEILA